MTSISTLLAADRASADWSSLAERVVTATPAQRLAAFRLACEALLIPPAEDADAGADAEPASKRQKRADAEDGAARLLRTLLEPHPDVADGALVSAYDAMRVVAKTEVAAAAAAAAVEATNPSAAAAAPRAGRSPSPRATPPGRGAPADEPAAPPSAAARAAGLLVPGLLPGRAARALRSRRAAAAGARHRQQRRRRRRRHVVGAPSVEASAALRALRRRAALAAALCGAAARPAPAAAGLEGGGLHWLAIALPAAGGAPADRPARWRSPAVPRAASRSALRLVRALIRDWAPPYQLIGIVKRVSDLAPPPAAAAAAAAAGGKADDAAWPTLLSSNPCRIGAPSAAQPSTAPPPARRLHARPRRRRRPPRRAPRPTTTTRTTAASARAITRSGVPSKSSLRSTRSGGSGRSTSRWRSMR